MDTTDFSADVDIPKTLGTTAATALDSKKLVSPRTHKPHTKALAMALVALGLVAAGVVIGPRLIGSPPSPVAARRLPSVTVSVPLQRDMSSRLQFLGQFSAVDRVELRAQVGGTLTQITFKDGDIVHKGDLLFVIDPTPYEIRLRQATAQLAAARARLELANQEFTRADSLSRTGVGSVQNTDQRSAERRAAQAAVDQAEALIRDAQFDLDHTRITAPFTGRIGSHLVSVGNLVAGSRAGTSPTTLLATLVSFETIYLDFDMSEAEFMIFARERQKQSGPLASKVKVSLSDEQEFTRIGTLDFVDNSLDRSSGTIHARATLANGDSLLTPGGFARVRLEVAPPAPVLLVPDASVLPDQSTHVVLTVDSNNVVTPKQVELGDLRDGLRVIRSGLTPTDKIIIDGIPAVAPGTKVSPRDGPIRFASQQSEK
jgi:multidrug efflux system membrane fusion protein